MNITAIIPARGNSKRVHRKNLHLIRGNPLIYYGITAALNSKRINQVFVSTEDQEIATVAKECGANIIPRPARLAQDDSSTVDVVLHALDELDRIEKPADLVILLQPTSPLTTSEDIDNAIQLYQKAGCDTVQSVCEAEHPPYWGYTIEGGFLKYLFTEEYASKRSQDLPKTYFPNGAIYLQSTALLRQLRSFLTPKTVPYIMPRERSIDIDTEFDFFLVEAMLDYQAHKKLNP